MPTTDIDALVREGREKIAQLLPHAHTRVTDMFARALDALEATARERDAAEAECARLRLIALPPEPLATPAQEGGPHA